MTCEMCGSERPVNSDGVCEECQSYLNEERETTESALRDEVENA